MIRRATRDDAAAIGALFVRARDEMTYLPRIPDRDRPLLGGRFLEQTEIWVAEIGGHVAGFAGVGRSELTHLYVDPPAQNRGVGTALLDHVKSLRPDRLELWVFQANEGARRFYERHGFRLVGLTDGAENMEREPDALYEWRAGRSATAGQVRAGSSSAPEALREQRRRRHHRV
jgi:ribosomal protein S18 acetylase RimI-like enzyme